MSLPINTVVLLVMSWALVLLVLYWAVAKVLGKRTEHITLPCFGCCCIGGLCGSSVAQSVPPRGGRI